jgi:hypothetical protein
MAHELEHTESILKSFLYKHGAVLNEESKKILNYAIGLSAENKFKIESPEVPSEVNDAADIVYKQIEKIESLLLEQVHSQSST